MKRVLAGEGTFKILGRHDIFATKFPQLCLQEVVVVVVVVFFFCLFCFVLFIFFLPNKLYLGTKENFS